MNENTKRLTTGAMLTAIFGAMLFLNRQTGGLFEEFMLFLLPIPMTAFASRYGFKASIAPFVAMSLISIFVSTPTAIFYAVTEAFIGVVLGCGVYYKRDMNRVLFEVMACSAVFNVLCTVILASLFGISITEEIEEMEKMMTNMITQVVSANPGGTDVSLLMTMLDHQFLLRMIVISAVLMGVIQGLIIFQLSLLILRRLHFTVPKPKSIYLVVPPLWTGLLSAVCFLAYSFSMRMALAEPVGTIVQTAGLCGYLYLVIFGFIGVLLFFKKKLPGLKFIGFLVAFFLMMSMPMVEMFLGFCYLIPQFHDRLIEGLELEKR